MRKDIDLGRVCGETARGGALRGSLRYRGAVFEAIRPPAAGGCDDVALRGSAALGTDRVALVPVHTAKCFLERFPTLTVCEIPFHTSQDSVELSSRNDLFEEKLFRKAANVLRGVLASVDWTIRTVALR